MSEEYSDSPFDVTGNDLIDRILDAVAVLAWDMYLATGGCNANILDDIQTQANIAAEFYAENYDKPQRELSRLLAERQAELLDG